MTYMSQQRENPKEKNFSGYNVTFGILSALAILMIVAGHAGYDILTVGGLFPYYSFHVPLFLFISGYFYRQEEEAHPLAYLKKKGKRLLVPYFAWNAVYGVISWALRAFGGFSMGEGLSLKTLFLSPFLNGYQFIYNYAAWFVPVLFMIEVMNLCMRLIIRRPLRRWFGTDGEWLFLLGSLAVGMLVVQFAIEGRVWGLYKTPGRILFLYPCFQMGQFYKKKLEEQDRLGNLPYFVIVIGVQVLLHLCCNGLAYSSVWWLCKRAVDSLCDGSVRYSVLATGGENPFSSLRWRAKRQICGGQLSAVSGAQHLCGDDAPCYGFYAGKDGSGGDRRPHEIPVRL